MWIRQCDLDADAAAPLPIPARIASNEEFIPPAQSPQQKEYEARLAVLKRYVGRLTVGERRAGHALAHAAIAGARHGGRRPHHTYAVQGFGTLGRATASQIASASVARCSDQPRPMMRGYACLDPH